MACNRVALKGRSPFNRRKVSGTGFGYFSWFGAFLVLKSLLHIMQVNVS